MKERIYYRTQKQLEKMAEKLSSRNVNYYIEKNKQMQVGYKNNIFSLVIFSGVEKKNGRTFANSKTVFMASDLPVIKEAL